jgi:tetratricopeptide (TPR) repeat protein
VSLLLDALKRAEEAKRAKAESGQSDDALGAQAPLDLEGTGASAPAASTPAKASGLSLEEAVSPSRDTTAAPAMPAGPAEDARGTVNATVPAAPLTLEQMIESELGPQQKPLVTSVSSATAAFRAARIGTKKPPSPELELAPTAAPGATNTETNPGDVDAKRRAINNAFAVKHAQATSGSRPAWMLPVVAVCIAGVGAGGWYVWQEINKVSRPAAAARSPSSAPSAVPPTTIASGSVTKAPTIAAPGGTPTATSPVEPPKEQGEAPLPPLLPPVSEAPPVTPSATPAASRPKAKEATETPREIVARKIEALPEPPAPRRVQLTLAKPTEQKPPSAPTSVGYAALLAGDWAAAKRSYAEAIAANPNDIDAHLGFATALARSGSGRKPEELGLAAKHYRRVLELDPRNAVASAALVAIESEFMPRGGSGGGRAATESELRIIVSQDPSNAAAQFLLGNTYAESRRWTEAQQAYFEAARLSPRNPDYLYNLAVSLDQLGQSRTALDFYRRALAVGAGGQFDRTQVERRIRNLSETTTTAEKIEPAAR